MTYFEDQEDAWYANDCKGRIEDYDPYDGDSWPEEKSRKRTAGGGRDRALLVLAKLEEFASWAVAQGYRRETPKGAFEILRLRIDKEPPLLYFRKIASANGGQPVHATCYGEGTKLVQKWLRTRNQGTQAKVTHYNSATLKGSRENASREINSCHDPDAFCNARALRLPIAG